MLSRLRNAGRRIASVSAAASSLWKGSVGSCSTRSALTLFNRRQTGDKTLKIPPGSASQSGPVAEGVEGAGGADHHHHQQQQQQQEQDQHARQLSLRRRNQRSLPLQCSASQRAPIVLQPQAVAHLSSLALGAPPPPFVFPEALEVDGNAAGGAAASTSQPPGQQLVDLMVTQQIEREARQQRLQTRAAAFVASWMPWTTNQPSSPEHPQRQGSGSRRYPAPPVATPGRQPAQRTPNFDQVPDDESYSWREFYQTLQLISLDPGGKLSGPGTALPASRAIDAGVPVGEGAETPGRGAQASEGRAAGSFTADLASLIAAAEEVTGDSPRGRGPQPPPRGVQQQWPNPPGAAGAQWADEGVEEEGPLPLGALVGEEETQPTLVSAPPPPSGAGARPAKASRAGRIRFLTESFKREREAKASPAFLEAALITLGEVGSGSGGRGTGSGAGGQWKGFGGGSVRFADAEGGSGAGGSGSGVSNLGE
jgi:hypothetical protein